MIFIYDSGPKILKNDVIEGHYDLAMAAYPACDISHLLQRLEYNAGYIQFKTNEEFSFNNIH